MQFDSVGPGPELIVQLYIIVVPKTHKEKDIL